MATNKPAGLVTPEDAEDRWCPFARIAHPLRSISVNRYRSGQEQTATMCIARACMLWREDSDDRGYCGMAGHPVAALTHATVDDLSLPPEFLNTSAILPPQKARDE